MLHPSDASMFPTSQAAEKEAALAQQEEEKAEQRKRARAEKKALKKKKKTRGADKRKAEEDDEKEWGDDEEGKASWKCYLGASPSSREVRKNIPRPSVLNHVRMTCLRGALSPFLSLPAVCMRVLPVLGLHAVGQALPCSLGLSAWPPLPPLGRRPFRCLRCGAPLTQSGSHSPAVPAPPSSRPSILHAAPALLGPPDGFDLVESSGQCCSCPCGFRAGQVWVRFISAKSGR